MEKDNQPPLDKFVLQSQNNIDLSGYAQSMPGMIMQAKINQGAVSAPESATAPLPLPAAPEGMPAVTAVQAVA